MKRLIVSGISSIAAIAFAVTIPGCEQPINENSYSVDHWLNDPDPCIRQTAAAIVASTQPWPNERQDASGKVVEFDAWYGNVRYRIPAGVPIIKSGFVPRSHPLIYSTVSGHISQLLPNVNLAQFGNLPATISGHIHCDAGKKLQVPPQFAWLAAATTAKAIKSTISEIAASRGGSRPQTRILESIDMVEINSTEGRRVYFPRTVELSQTVEGERLVAGIVCDAHDPQKGLDITKTCQAWMLISPGIWLEFQVYQQFLPLVPQLHREFLYLFAKSQSRRSAGDKAANLRR
ncbi:hypothetical protein [Pelomonas cellulosilytica]|uniref:Uncharacterized protein n=1 Tax=Pelomonas cellulosilytica TaxID=2906762 RepID=A0ABS8Y321_9BURK|nr:hypothetical protein [Pelomonas sp. P8]MCE4558168.1 hypothetical protein [Pelomonas sp. P8]